MSTKISINKLPTVIEPSKSIIEDLEILAFETSEQLEFYSLWHETLFDKRRELNAESEREKQIIRNEIARKTKQFLLGSYNTTSSSVEAKTSDKFRQGPSSSKSKSKSNQSSVTEHVDHNSSLENGTSSQAIATTSSTTSLEATEATTAALTADVIVSEPSPSKSTASNRSRNSGSTARRSNQNHCQHEQQQQQNELEQIEVCQPPYLYYVPAKPDLPNGLTILNSTYYNTLPTGKQLMKYKLTKLYNKFRGRQTRRNFVAGKQKAARLESEMSKSHLNHWLAYTALQALRLPESNVNQLSTIAINNNPKFITIPQMRQPSATGTSVPPSSPPSSSKKGGKNSKKQQQAQSPVAQQQQSTHQNKAPMHLVYIDPSDIVTYSNKINPQQIIAYRRRPQILPSSATSKKSSAASYDVFEIMEVLANSDKTNVTITRNANRPAPPGCSIFSQSVNANTPGIVSTQLHLQARSYLDSVGKFYAEEALRIAKEAEDLKKDPSIDEQISKYIRIDHSYVSKDPPSESMNFSDINDYRLSDLSGDHSSEQDEDVLDRLEEDILSMLKHQDNLVSNGMDNSQPV